MQQRRTKIVATIGPASWDEPVLRKLIQEGINVVRLNFSHAKHERAALLIELIQRIAQEERKNIGILQDLQGPRIRTGAVDPTVEKIILTPGQEVNFTTRSVLAKTSSEIGIDYPGLPLDVKPGDKLLIEDGLLELRVLATTQDSISCTVITGGLLGSHKGINVPGVTLGVPTITSKDIQDLQFGVEHGVDYVALSFVRQAEDIVRLKNLIKEFGGDKPANQLPRIIAKIEKHEAITNIDAIIDAADGIMVARGDLGVEMPAERIPVLQKMIIHKCNLLGKPVITATQMLDSMIRNPRPTRAEATDVANAIIDGTDAVMLSGESANGSYPVQAVQVMGRIAQVAEEEVLYKQPYRDVVNATATSITDAISQAVCSIGREVHAKAIITTTTSGTTPRMVSRNRPHLPIYAATHEPSTMRKLALVWGVESMLCDKYESTDEMFYQAEQVVLQSGQVKKGDVVIITAGVPVGTPGLSNLLKVQVVGTEHRPNVTR